jgi:hypothetical protein
LPQRSAKKVTASIQPPERELTATRLYGKEDQNFNFHICENTAFIWVWNLVSHTKGGTPTKNEEDIWAAEGEVRGK